MEMPIVLFLIDTLQVGGAEKSILEICSRFKKYTPIVFQLYEGDTLYKDYIEAGIQVKRFNFQPNHNLFQISHIIYPEIKRINPAIIHSTLFRSNIVSRYLKKSLEIKLINSFVNNSYSKQRYDTLSKFEKIKLLGVQIWDRFTINSVDHFISNSVTIKNTNAKKLKISSDRITVIYRGRDLSIFQSKFNRELYKEKFHLQLEGKKIFLNVSRLIERKGQLDLIRAFAKVNNLYSNTILLIAGEGSFRLVIEKEIEKLKLQNVVYLLGNRDDIPFLLKSSDYFVFPSYFEGLPGVLIEAMFSKIPIIASNIPENLECISSNMALLFNPGDISDIAHKMMISLSANDWDIKTELAFIYASNNFEIHNVSLKYESLYDSMVSFKEKY